MIPVRYRFQRSLEKNLPPIAAAALGRLPRFVYGRDLGSSLPVFVYHAVDRSFEDDLRYLRAGGYRTAGIAEIESFLATGRPHVPRTVVLTFDDGDVSLTSVAAPLLHAYGFRAIGFVVSGLVPDRSDGELSGWQELRAAVAQGSLEIGPHSLFHHHVPVSSQVIGTVDATTPTGFRANIPIPRVTGDAAITPGMPILRGRPRYLTRTAFRPDAAAVREWTAAGKPAHLAGDRETDLEAERAIIDDMTRAQAVIAERCPNRGQHHLCYPWYAGDEWTDRLAGRAGVRCVYAGVERPTRLGTAEPPPRLQRLSSNFLRCLPGPGRVALPGVIARSLAEGFSRRQRRVQYQYVA
jgi:hypothetical protein